MKQTIKLMSVLLVLVMILSAFAACSPDTGNGDSSTPAPGESSTPSQSTPDPNASTPEASTPEQSSTQDLTSWIPPQMNLDKEMNVFVGELYDEEWMDTDNGDLVGTELYGRVLRVEKNLGIELNVTRMFGDSGHREEIMSEVRKRQETTDPNMMAALCSTYSQFAGSLTLEGVYQTINNSDYIDFENPWWPDDLINNSTIDGKVYFVSGDISPTLLYEIYAIFYNRKLIEKYNIEDPITLVNNHEWTIDKLVKVTSDIYEDTNNAAPGPSDGDFFAFEFFDGAHYKALPFSMGIRVIEPDEEDGYVWSELYTGLKMESVLEKVVTWIQNNPGVPLPAGEEVKNGSHCFRNESAIFTLGNFGFAKGELAGSGIDYAVVPCPMYDTDQETYLSYYGNPSSFWGIPSNVDVDDACALLESLAADAYVYISPALFERALKFKYVTGDVDGLSKMFDIIRDGLVFDACMFYNAHIGGNNYKQFAEIGGSSTSWVINFQGFKLNAMKAAINGIVSKLRALPY